MRILHINTEPEGGAAWCARRIYFALEQQGIENKMLFAHADTLPECIDGAIAQKDHSIWNKNWFTVKFRHLLNRIPFVYDVDGLNYKLWKINSSFPEPLNIHHPFSSYTNISQHPLVEWADIIHLHWVSGFIDYPTFFKEIGKPIVWTLHDKNPAVGLLHYCSNFSPVPKELKALDSLSITIKRKGVLSSKNLHIVAISEQMKTICSKSEVLKGFPCTLIHNGVDCDTFLPIESPQVNVSIPEESTVFLFSAFNIWDKNKGLQRVIDAIENIDCKNKTLIVIGGTDSNEPHASFPIFCTGLIRDQKELNNYYSVADLFIMASYEEAFGQTPLEAMACGIPVVSTPCGVASELIRPFNGVVCSGFDSDAIAQGISKALKTKYNSDTIRKYILDVYDYRIIANQYINLYQSLL